MIINFYKFQGTGNDFILIDDREELFDVNNSLLISSMCERKFGIGADGLILLRDHKNCDFEMIFFNSTGQRSTFCGNGGRCIISFANLLGIFDNSCRFMAFDGVHEGVVRKNDVSMKMSDVNNIDVRECSAILDTGSPHLVKITNDLKNINVIKNGKKLSQSPEFGDYGINVNFVELNDGVSIRTYERGDEMESLSCGTGSVATAIALFELKKSQSTNLTLKTNGGNLTVSFKYDGVKYTDIWLTGKASIVYSGEFKC